MHYFHNEQIAKLKSLLAARQIEVLSKQGGGNSAVYSILADGKKWALKSYPPYAPNQRDRLSAELQVYQFLQHHQVNAIPQLKAYDQEERWLIIDWIEGKMLSHYSTKEIDQAIGFIRIMHSLASLPDALALHEAAEACLSLAILIEQIKQRLARLQQLALQENNLVDFLQNQFIPVFDQHQQHAIHGYAQHGLDQHALLPQEKRSLIPADFGFHNAIIADTGQLYFFDFDYFGWDDPVKLLADILWHPKMVFHRKDQQQIIDGIANIYQADQFFLPRFYYTWPLFGLRWVLILLNEFIPAYWQNRQHANVHQDQEQAKHIQLQRANELLIRIKKIGCRHEITTPTSV